MAAQYDRPPTHKKSIVHNTKVPKREVPHPFIVSTQLMIKKCLNARISLCELWVTSYKILTKLVNVITPNDAAPPPDKRGRHASMHKQPDETKNLNYKSHTVAQFVFPITDGSTYHCVDICHCNWELTLSIMTRDKKIRESNVRIKHIQVAY